MIKKQFNELNLAIVQIRVNKYVHMYLLSRHRKNRGEKFGQVTASAVMHFGKKQI